MRAVIPTFPGSNGDYDCYKAIRDVLGEEARFVWHRERILGECDVVVLPGGFSYGDYLRAGAIARFSPIMPAVQRFASEGGLVLGICNGFRIGATRTARSTTSRVSSTRVATCSA